jgi:predicted Rossmann fold flavoprotein
MKHTVAVVGGGPAGLMAAARAAERGNQVILIEKQPFLAQKLRITGKGRCNITNSADISTFIEKINSNPYFLYSAFYTFTNTDVIQLFHQLNVPTKEERGGRVFPVSDRAKDVAEALIAYAKSQGVSIQNGRVDKLLVQNGCILGVKLKDGKEILADRIVIATGGMSYPKTGSTGDGYRLAQQAGHNVVPPKPALVPLETAEPWAGDLMGLSLKNVTATILNQKGKTIFSELGEMLFTHFGVSGPLILSASAHMKNIETEGYRLIIDLKPALTRELLDKRIQRDFAAELNKNFSNALTRLLPQKLIPVVIDLCGIEPTQKVNQITKQQRGVLLDVLKQLTLHITKARPIEEAIVTAGGVCTDEINPSTMESKLTKGLYFAGEVIDVDGYTGGYNLQIAFSTGYLAGEHV